MVPEDRIMRLRFVDTDKNQGIRGKLSYKELECIPKSRLVVPGFGDPDALAGKLRTDAPTLTPEGTTLIGQLAASKGWRLHQGDVDSAFLNGREQQIFMRPFPRERS